MVLAVGMVPWRQVRIIQVWASIGFAGGAFIETGAQQKMNNQGHEHICMFLNKPLGEPNFHAVRAIETREPAWGTLAPMRLLQKVCSCSGTSSMTSTGRARSSM